MDNEESDQTSRMYRLICLLWAHMSDGMFSLVAAQLLLTNTIMKQRRGAGAGDGIGEGLTI